MVGLRVFGQSETGGQDIFEKDFASLGKVETTISSKKGTRIVKHLDIVEVQFFFVVATFSFQRVDVRAGMFAN